MSSMDLPSSSAASVKLIDFPNSKETSGSRIMLSFAVIVTFFLITLLLLVHFLASSKLDSLDTSTSASELGNGLVFGEEVIDDDFGELGVRHVFTSAFLQLHVVYLEYKVFLNQFRVINIFPIEHCPKDINPVFPQSVIACSFGRKTLVDNSSQSSSRLMHVVHIHAWMLV
ncbi:hypothetical protein Tco_0705520 [Tanacetum coccineum]|uniref:Uncharacterized protein n=1 Tax=Tanacetum coccineum TaxID=301880 RepID=A0ABQ4Y503_9ASTR